MKAIKITHILSKNEVFGRNITAAAKASSLSAKAVLNKKSKIPLPFVFKKYLIEEIEIH